MRRAGLPLLSIAVAVVLSGNRMIYDFGPGGPVFKKFGNGVVAIAQWGEHSIQLSFPLCILIVLTALFGVVLKMTAWGRYILAIGGNEHSARLMGLPVRRTLVGVYALSGLCSALGGVLFTFYMLSGYGLHALGLELDAIAAVVIGGTLLSGGVGLDDS